MKFLSQPRRASLVLLVVTLVLIALAATSIEDRRTFLVVLGILLAAHLFIKMKLLKHHLKDISKGPHTS